MKDTRLSNSFFPSVINFGTKTICAFFASERCNDYYDNNNGHQIERAQCSKDLAKFNSSSIIKAKYDTNDPSG